MSLTPKEYQEIRQRVNGNYTERRNAMWIAGYNAAVTKFRDVMIDYLSKEAKQMKARIDYKKGV